MRRGVYFLLAVFMVQLSGLRVFCVPSHGQTHACCPMCTKTALPSSSPLPDCCIRSVLNFQGSIAEIQNSVGQSGLTAQSGTVSVPLDAPLAAISTQAPRRVLPSTSPPRSPLSQSCLLLI